MAFVSMALVGALMFGAGVAVVANGEWRAGGTAVAFGAAILSSLPLFASWPRGRRGIRSTMLPVDGEQATGVLFPYSAHRSFAIMLTCAFFGLACLGFLVLAREFDGGDSEVWVTRVVGAPVLSSSSAERSLWAPGTDGRRWQVVLLPRAVIFHGAGQAAAPWDAIADIEAHESTFYARGFPIHERFIRIVTREPAAIAGDQYDQAMRQLFPSVATDVTMPIRSLAVDPKALLYALRFYHSNPDARAELCGLDAVRRIRSGRIRPADQ